MELLWLFAAVFFGILEAATAQLVSVWFAGGAVCALFASLAGADITVQCIIFAAVSAIILLCTRPLAKKLTKNVQFKTNTDGLIGKTAVMTKPCNADGINGEAKLDGKFWTVCSSAGTSIDAGSRVTVEKIEGVKLIVKEEAVITAE